MRTYKHLTFIDRLNIEKLYRQGKNAYQISKILRVHNTTIYRELKKGKYLRTDNCSYKDYLSYSPEIADKKYRENLKEKGQPIKIGNDIKYSQYLENLILKEKYSPSSALAKARTENFQTQISINTLYKYIDKGLFIHLTNKNLPVKKEKKRGYHKIHRIHRPKGESLENRPKNIESRKTYGHWEMDTVEGKKGENGIFLVLTERKTRYEIIKKMERKTAENVKKALDELEIKYKNFKEIFITITVDNGSEFNRTNELETSIDSITKRTKLYYCHPYTASERGSNENANKLIRRHYPKGISLKNVTSEQVQDLQNWINTYPRKLLNWQSSQDIIPFNLN